MSKQEVAVTVEPIAVSFKQFYTSFYPMSRAKANTFAASGELETFLEGSRRMVLMEKAHEFVARRVMRGGKVSPEVSAVKSAAGRAGVERQRELRAEAEAREKAAA